eukprot:Em0014g470a
MNRSPQSIPNRRRKCCHCNGVNARSHNHLPSISPHSSIPSSCLCLNHFRPTSPVMNSSSNNPRPLPPNVGHNLQLVANATPQVPIAHLCLALGFKNKTFSFVPIVSSRTVRHIPLKDRLAFALVLSSALSVQADITSLCLSVVYAPNGPKTAVSLAREELLSKACQTLTSSGLAPDNNTTWNLLHGLKAPKGTPPTPPTAPLLVAPYLPPDFNIMAVLHSFSKDTAAEVPLQFPICAVLKEVVNMLISGKLVKGVQKRIFMASEAVWTNTCTRAAPMVSMVLWATSRFVALFGYYFFRNRCTTRARCSHCSGSRHHPSEPPLGLNINIAKCELFSSRDLSSFPEEMRRSNVPHFEILGAPIGDLVFCAKFVAQKQSEASKLLKELEAVSSIDPQVALLLLRQSYIASFLSSGLSPSSDVLVPNWDLGKPAAFDLSVTSTLQSSALLETSVTAGSAALLTENRKHNNSDKKCDELGWACIPLVVETYGCWGG